jgi:uncharacterized coiled-coil protein SlyX
MNEDVAFVDLLLLDSCRKNGNFACAASVYIDRAAFSVKVGIMKTTLPLKSSMHRASSRGAFLLIPILLVCFGLAPMAQAVGPDTEGTIPGSNNGEGIGVLVSRTTGIWNTGTGFEALKHLTAGNQNTATGLRALFSDISCGYNTATSVYSLYTNTTGFFNSATGAYSLANNTDGTYNTANGYSALYFNTEGEANTANGFAAVYRNATGTGNTANGYQALEDSTTGFLNTANGYRALSSNTAGSNNTALGFAAGINVTTANNVVCVGALAVGENFSDRAYIPNIGVFPQAPAAGIEFVTVRLSDGKLGHDASSRRYKEDIKPMDNASEVLYKLKPVTYRFKEVDVDPNKGPEPQNLDYGLIAEDVAEIDPKLAVRNGKGQIESLRYMAIYNMMLNEFLKEHRKVAEQEATIAQLTSTVAQQKKDFQATVAQLTARLDEQRAQIQKVSTQLEGNKTVPQIVLNNQ